MHFVQLYRAGFQQGARAMFQMGKVGAFSKTAGSQNSKPSKLKPIYYSLNHSIVITDRQGSSLTLEQERGSCIHHRTPFNRT